MRETDRGKNGMKNFPQLFYPELYLLDGGYKAFFNEYPVCVCTRVCVCVCVISGIIITKSKMLISIIKLVRRRT